MCIYFLVSLSHDASKQHKGFSTLMPIPRHPLLSPNTLHAQPSPRSTQFCYSTCTSAPLLRAPLLSSPLLLCVLCVLPTHCPEATLLTGLARGGNSSSSALQLAEETCHDLSLPMLVVSPVHLTEWYPKSQSRWSPGGKELSHYVHWERRLQAGGQAGKPSCPGPWSCSWSWGSHERAAQLLDSRPARGLLDRHCT